MDKLTIVNQTAACGVESATPEMSREAILALVLSKLLDALPGKCAVLEARHVPAGMHGLCCETIDYDLTGRTHNEAGADSR